MFQTLWILLTYSYNAVLVLFIATHLFVGAIISFLTGMYMGVYLSQNFEVPRISEPRIVWEKFLSFLERNRKDPKKVSVGNVLHPRTIKELVVVKEEADSEESPSKTETICVPEKRDSATFVQAGSQTEIGGLVFKQEEKDQTMVTSNYLGKDEADDVEEIGDDISATDEDLTTTLVPNLLSNRIVGREDDIDVSSENPTTLILTEPEDLSEGFKIISSAQIVEGSLTLDNDRAISRSFSKLN